ncbi:MAG TPA: hypothetical protein DC042_02555, partial [Bacteroidales bacterium]|nr:hypothetical protein [Bacteroidales bacterium]
MDFQRRVTRIVNIGGVPMGGHHPVRVQTMTNLPTSDIDGQVAQILRAAEAGAEYVRVTVPTLKDVEYLALIKERLNRDAGRVTRDAENRQESCMTRDTGPRHASRITRHDIPLIADVHFSPKIAIAAAKVAAKVRINPGNLVEGERRKVKGERKNKDFKIQDLDFLEVMHSVMRPLLDTCKEYGTALRIGTNHGSLSARILDQYGDTPEG